MAQQMVNGSHYEGDVTVTNRMSRRYAVVNLPFEGKHKKPQDRRSLARRHLRWQFRRMGYSAEEVDMILRRK